MTPPGSVVVCGCGTVAKLLRSGRRRYGHECPHGVPCDMGRMEGVTQNQACPKCVAISQRALQEATA